MKCSDAFDVRRKDVNKQCLVKSLREDSLSVIKLVIFIDYIALMLNIKAKRVFMKYNLFATLSGMALGLIEATQAAPTASFFHNQSDQQDFTGAMILTGIGIFVGVLYALYENDNGCTDAETCLVRY